MKARDPLAVRLQPADRVHYATGMLLDAEDFSAEQTYHRGRLARALTYLHGYGTIAGLRVVIEGDPGEEQVVVNPGIALDRLGRVIEVPASSCIRLNRWYEQRSDDDLAQGFHAGAVIVDVFVTFRECERGKTPALAAGPFDALDAVVASRLRDSFEVELVIRHEGTPPQPERQWPATGGRRGRRGAGSHPRRLEGRRRRLGERRSCAAQRARTAAGHHRPAAGQAIDPGPGR